MAQRVALPFFEGETGEFDFRVRLLNFLQSTMFTLTKTVTTSGQLQHQPTTLLADATAGAITLTLPTANNMRDGTLLFKKVDNSANAVVIAAKPGDTIDGSSTLSLSQVNDCAVLVSDGRNWYILTTLGGGVTTTPGASNDATYVTADGTGSPPPHYRVLTAGSNITITDNGPAHTITVSAVIPPVIVPVLDASFLTADTSGTLPVNYRRVVAGSNIVITDNPGSHTFTIDAVVPPAVAPDPPDGSVQFNEAGSFGGSWHDRAQILAATDLTDGGKLDILVKKSGVSGMTSRVHIDHRGHVLIGTDLITTTLGATQWDSNFDGLFVGSTNGIVILGGGTDAQASLYFAGSSTFGNIGIDAQSFNGTWDSPTKTLDGDELFRIIVRGSDGSGTGNASEIAFWAEGSDWANSATQAGYITFATRNLGSFGLQDRLRLNAAGGLVLGGDSGTTAVAATGELAMKKISPTGTAPGAGWAKMEWVAGTNPGTAKLICYAGTGTTPIDIVDNVGTGF